MARWAAVSLCVSFAGGSRVVEELSDILGDAAALGPAEVYQDEHLHAFVNMGDGGCYQHLVDKDSGEFRSPRDSKDYELKFCPFPDIKDKVQAEYRRLLKEWYTLATRLPCKEPGEYAKDNPCGTMAPFAVSDLGAACVTGGPKELHAQYRLAFKGQAMKVKNEEFCNVMMHLPLMWDAVGFDASGVVLQSSKLRPKWTFNGFPHKHGGRTLADASTSKPLKPLGPSEKVRLALRALLPTYFLRSYAAGGSSPPGSIATSPTKYKSQLELVNYYVKWKNLDHNKVLSVENTFENKKLISGEALDRDSSKTGCAEVIDCARGPGKVCGLCSEKGSPCADLENLDPNLCQPHSLLGTCPDNTRECEAEEPATCQCHTAGSEHFTADLAAAIEEIVIPE